MLGLTLVLAGAALLHAWVPVTVAILDIPVDLEHPEIAAALDLGFLEQSRARSEAGHVVTWKDLNNEARANFERLRDGPIFKTAIELIRLTRQEGDAPTPSARLTELKDLYQTDAHLRAQVELASAYMHGTHVAGILLRGLRDIRLIPIPQFARPLPPAPAFEPDPNLSIEDALAQLREMGRKNADYLLNLDIAQETAATKRLYDSISETLKAQGVKVLNASIGFSPAALVDSWRAMVMDPELWSTLDERLIEKALRITEMQRLHFEKLVTENPQTAFVIASGNEGKFLGRAGVSIATKINAPNLVTVAATDRKGKLASFSNRHAGIVDIAARGENVSSALVGGGRIIDSGTSMGAPEVTNVLTKIFGSFPGISPEQAIGRLYQDHVVRSEALRGAVEQERLLKPRKELLRYRCGILFM